MSAATGELDSWLSNIALGATGPLGSLREQRPAVPIKAKLPNHLVGEARGVQAGSREVLTVSGPAELVAVEGAGESLDVAEVAVATWGRWSGW